MAERVVRLGFQPMQLARFLTRQQGYLDAVDARRVVGWAFNPALPNTPLEVELLIDDAPVGTFTADRFRDDLRQAGKGDGRHGFDIPLPPLSAGEHRVAVRVAGSTRTLRGSPKVVGGGAAVPSEAPLDVRGALSVVVTTTNVGGAIVDDCLRALLACAGQLDLEVIAVDGGSSDDTPRRLTILARESPQFRWIHSGGGHAVGINDCRHDLVLLLSGDVRPATLNLLAHHVRAHEGREVVVRGRGSIDGWPQPPGSPPNNVSMRKGREDAPTVDVPEAVVVFARPRSIREVIHSHMLAGISHPMSLTPTDAATPVEDWLSVIEGVNAWASVLDRHYRLGSQPWHGAYVDAVLDLAYSQGRAMSAPEGDRAAAYRAMLDQFQGRLASTASDEAVARLLKGAAA